MANNKQRYINTRFWNDNYISELDPIEKLLFIYFITNEHTNISGIYELPQKIIGIETGIDVSMIIKIMPRLESRIRYIKGYVIIKNFVKHQETGSELVQKGILNCLKDLDLEFLKNLVNKGYYILPVYYMDTLSIPYAKGLNYLDSNSDLDSNLGSDKSHTLIIEIIEAFKEINPSYKSWFGNKTQRLACKWLLDTYGLEDSKKKISFLEKLNTIPYAPTTTTPHELKNNMAKIKAFIEKEKNISLKSVKPIFL